MAKTIHYSRQHRYRRLRRDSSAKPMLRVRIRHESKTTPDFLALVDSGADATVLHTDIANFLGIDLTTCQQATASGVGGLVSVYRCAVELELEGHRFDADVLPTDGVDPTQPLLGREDVFREFQFGFDQRAELLLVERY